MVMSKSLTNTPFLSLIIPSYQQEKTIIKNLIQVKKALDQIRYDYEIIVVLDGIVDQSLTKIKKARIPKVNCLAYPKNQGKASALRLGIGQAKGEYVMFLDAGMEIDASSISMLIEHMKWYGGDIIVGSKRHPASQVNYPFMRKILSDGYFFLTKLLFNLKVRDTQAGIKIFRKKVIKDIYPRLLQKRFAGELEMLVVADLMGYKRIFEAPIKLDYTLSPVTSAATVKSILNILIDTAAIFYRKNILHYYGKKITGK